MKAAINKNQTKRTQLIMHPINSQLPASPLLSQPPDESTFCDADKFEKQNKDCGHEWCECVHRIKVSKRIYWGFGFFIEIKMNH